MKSEPDTCCLMCLYNVYSLTSSVVPDIQPQPAAVHALNILRALYRDSRLGAYVVPFIPEGVIIAIEGFSAAFWPVSIISMYHAASQSTL